MTTGEKVNALAKAAADKGLLIEAGWLGMVGHTYPNGTTPEQFDQLRAAFFAGAQHLFASIMGILDPGQEPTDADLSRMTLIQHELDAFIQDYKKQHAHG